MIGTGGCSLDVSRMEKSSHTEDILLSPAPYAHWTIRECLQQPEAIARSLAFGGMNHGSTEKFDARVRRGTQLKGTVCTSCVFFIFAPIRFALT